MILIKFLIILVLLYAITCLSGMLIFAGNDLIAVDNISVQQVTVAHANGLMVAVYNTHSRNGTRDAIRMNVDYIQNR